MWHEGPLPPSHKFMHACFDLHTFDGALSDTIVWNTEVLSSNASFKANAPTKQHYIEIAFGYIIITRVYTNNNYDKISIPW